MRLIDADEVMRILERNAKRYPYRQIGRPDTYSPYNEAWTDAINQVDAEVSVLPTITPECKRGRWRRKLVDSGFNADWYCSECGWKTILEEHGYNYCPNCGADMRGEQNEAD